MSDLKNRIKKDIVNAINNNTLVLPTLPEIALQVREVAEDPESSIQQLTGVLNHDVAITARIISVCNSPLLRGNRKITDLNMAVSRLGMSYTANLATGLAMEQMFQATSEMIDKRIREVWQTSTEIAGICYVLATHYTELKPDQATLAGLVHQIGVLPILTYIEENDLRINNVILDNLIDVMAPAIGSYILKKWDFPADLIIVPKEHCNFKRVVPTADYADIVMVARLQSLAETGHPYTKMKWSSISAFERLGLDPEIDNSEAEDLSEEIENAIALIQ